MRKNLKAIFGVLVAVGAWSIDRDLTTWASMGTPGHTLSLLGAIGSVLLAWLNQSPIKPKV